MHATGRFLLWVDCIETIVSVDSTAFEQVLADGGEVSAPFITRVDGQLVSVLSPAVFDPGRILQPGRAPG